MIHVRKQQMFKIKFTTFLLYYVRKCYVSKFVSRNFTAQAHGAVAMISKRIAGSLLFISNYVRVSICVWAMLLTGVATM
jgi:hypothetical protein